ncbi:hypothetical protein P8625_06270 [Tenacibaculum tangerinum]|uniref:Uncharacterized protein n=1 Tax=Tenacibaculum tangerinum TaxID=3038772 RepID=A0ABY8L810_9FLAO|nr:hypothetical protein [Tenacibaculum tangerinum]WGH76757.1 hypothetical protein P8625_06270 [Tenacibaculum tangerinum]
MNSVDWNKIAQEAASQTDSEFNAQLASLTNLKISEVDAFIKESKITNANAVKTLKLVNDTTIDNNEKAKAISNIENGFSFIISLVSKII